MPARLNCWQSDLNEIWKDTVQYKNCTYNFVLTKSSYLDFMRFVTMRIKGPFSPPLRGPQNFNWSAGGLRRISWFYSPLRGNWYAGALQRISRFYLPLRGTQNFDLKTLAGMQEDCGGFPDSTRHCVATGMQEHCGGFPDSTRHCVDLKTLTSKL